MPEKAKVVIVGGGTLGLSTAFYLALSNSFGFGGHNITLVAKKYE